MQATQMRWRVREGGLGLRARSGAYAAASWIASWAQCYHTVTWATAWQISQHFSAAPPGSLGSLLFTAVEEIYGAGGRIVEPLLAGNGWRGLADESLRGLQKGLRHLLDKTQQDGWWTRASSDQAAMAGSCSGWGAGVVLLRAPTERILQISDIDLRIAICERLKVPLGDNDLCIYVSQRC